MASYYICECDWTVSLESKEELKKRQAYGPFWSEYWTRDKLDELIRDYETQLARDGEFYLKYITPNTVKYDFGFHGRVFIITIDETAADSEESNSGSMFGV